MTSALQNYKRKEKINVVICYCYSRGLRRGEQSSSWSINSVNTLFQGSHLLSRFLQMAGAGRNRNHGLQISHLLVLFTVIPRSPLTLSGSKTGNSQGRCPKFSVSAFIAPSWINSISHFIEAFSFRYLTL